MLTRKGVIAAVRAALESLPEVVALVEGGSTAFGRADELSDIDLIANVDDGTEEGVFAVLERALALLVREHNPACPQPILVRKVIPQPAWHGMAQRFYKLAETSEWLILDIALRPASRPEHFAERERHGEPIVLFDKTGQARSTTLDLDAWNARLVGRLGELRDHFALFGNFAEKEVRRGRVLDAWSMYQGLLLRPLVELLRIKYCPARHDYGLRYAQDELPPSVLQRLTELHFVKDLADISHAQAEARQWAAELLQELTDASGRLEHND